MATRIILDTNILIAALRSSRGASYRILSMLGEGAFELCLSVPLFTEYEAKVLEQLSELNIDEQDVEQLLDYLVSQARLQEVFYLWRPILQDPKDDMVLEAAVAADVKYLVTHNIRDFTQAKTFAVRVVTPGSFLKEILI